MTRHYPRQVSPFGDPRIKVCSQLPEAFRSVLRPSSALATKASTVCPCLHTAGTRPETKLSRCEKTADCSLKPSGGAVCVSACVSYNRTFRYGYRATPTSPRLVPPNPPSREATEDFGRNRAGGPRLAV